MLTFQRSRLLCGLLGASIAVAPTLAVTIPPIAFEGRFENSARTNIPEDGEQSVQLSTRATLGLRSYVWQPWFATVGASFSLSQTQTYAGVDSTSRYASGSVQANVFPSSRFPFTAFAGVSDSRDEFDSAFTNQRQVRRTHFGFQQEYQPLAGNARYRVRVERNIENGTEDSAQQVSDHLNVDATYDFTEHELQGSLTVTNTTEDKPDRSLRDLVATLRHSYRAQKNLSVENFASLTDIVGAGSQTDVHVTTTTLSSVGIWRPSGKPMTVTANARLSTNTSDSGGDAVSSYNSSLGVSATYTLSPALRVSGTVAGAFASGIAGSAVSTSQSASASYSPAGFKLLGTDYSWYASASVNNSTGGSASRGMTLGAGHSAGHAVSLDESAGIFAGITLSGNVSESVSGTMDTTSSGARLSINHGASLALSRAALQSSSRASLTLTDNRSLGTAEDASSIQSASFQLTHDYRFGRFSSLGGGVHMSLTRTESERNTQTFTSSSLDLNYRHARLFGVPRLRFLSQLSMDADSLVFFVAGTKGRSNLSWNNRMNYSIGRIDMRLSGVVSDNNGRMNTSIFFTLVRRIGGVF